MTDLVARLELTKLALELGASEAELGFLTELGADDLRELRTTISHSLYARHESRFGRMAALSKLVPVGLSAKASGMVGPVLSARLAAALEPAHAVKLAKAMKPRLLADVARHLDPDRVTAIVTALPDEIVVVVGKQLIADDAFLTLGRFTAVVAPDTALKVTDECNGHQLLSLALYTEDRAALDAIVTRIDDPELGTAVRAAAHADEFAEALALMAVLSVENRARVIEQAALMPVGEQDGLVAAVIENEAWAMLLPALELASDEAVSALVNLPATLAQGVLGGVLDLASEAQRERTRSLLDAAHAAALS